MQMPQLPAILSGPICLATPPLSYASHTGPSPAHLCVAVHRAPLTTRVDQAPHLFFVLGTGIDITWGGGDPLLHPPPTPIVTKRHVFHPKKTCGAFWASRYLRHCRFPTVALCIYRDMSRFTPPEEFWLWHVCTSGSQHKAQRENWLISGLRDHRYFSVTEKWT